MKNSEDIHSEQGRLLCPLSQFSRISFHILLHAIFLWDARRQVPNSYIIYDSSVGELLMQFSEY